MNAKLIFYTLLVGILGATGYFAYRMLSPAENRVVEAPQRKSVNSGASSSVRNSQSQSFRDSTQQDSRSSIWTDDARIETQLDAEQLRQSAEIRQALSLLQELYKLSDKESFIEKTQELMAKYPKAPHFPAALADHYYNTGDFLNAETYLKMTLEKQPGYTFAQNSLADVYVKQGKFEEAASTYSDVYENQGVDNIYAYQGHLGVATMMGNAEDLQQKFIQMHKAQPQKTNLALTVADIHFVEGNLEERDRVLKEQYQRDPNHPLLNVVMAQDARTRGDLEAALLHGQKAVDHDVDNGRKFNMLREMMEVAQELDDQNRVASLQEQMNQLRGR